MNYLAIDTSGSNLTVIVCKQDKIYTFFDENCGTHHSVRLLDETEKLCELAGFDLKDADFFAVVTGAGSFTGIRIGVATVKALCLAYRKPCLNITSFDTIAYNKDKDKVLAIIDANHNGYYICGYNGGKVTVSPSFVHGEDLKSYADYEFLTGENPKNINCKKVSVEEGLIKAIAAKYKEATFDYSSVTPLYVRKSQAEEGR